MSDGRPPTDESIISWKSGDLIGIGSFGEVRTAINNTTGSVFAVKTLRRDMGNAATIDAEIKLLMSLEHPNIVRNLGCEVHSTVVHIFMEYCPSGSVQNILRTFGPLPGAALQSYVRQIVQGLAYLHYRGIIHRDIKPANLLLGPSGEIRLSDFGCARVQSESIVNTTSVLGTPAFMSPEAITGKLSAKSDVWSLGCTVLELATGETPYLERSFEHPLQLLLLIAQGTPPPHGCLPVSALPSRTSSCRVFPSGERTGPQQGSFSEVSSSPKPLDPLKTTP